MRIVKGPSNKATNLPRRPSRSTTFGLLRERATQSSCNTVHSLFSAGGCLLSSFIMSVGSGQALQLADYLEKLPGTTFKKLYLQPSTAFAIFRCMLPPLGKKEPYSVGRWR